MPYFALVSSDWSNKVKNIICVCAYFFDVAYTSLNVFLSFFFFSLLSNMPQWILNNCIPKKKDNC